MEIKADCTRYPHYTPEIPPIIEWLVCDSCGHSFTSGYFDSDAMSVITHKTHEAQILTAKMAHSMRQINADIVSKISDLRGSSNGSWLDVGFGNGALLMAAQEFGYQVAGLDLRESSVKALKPYVNNVKKANFFDIDTPGIYDVISMADVLEHLPFPPDAIAKANFLSSKDGLLFISLPHYNSAVWKLMSDQNSNPYWMELEHFHNFSRDRLYNLLTEHGFAPCHYGVSKRYLACMEVIAKKAS